MMEFNTDMNTKKDIAEKAIKAMIQIGVITFSSLSICGGLVDVNVTSGVFMDKTFVASVYEDDWNSCPARAVVSELAELIVDGELEFVPLAED